MYRLLRLAWLALLVCVPAAAQAEWREASGRHFLVYSEGSADSVRDFAAKLETFDKAMRLRLGFDDVDLGPANRVTVYIVDDVSQVRRLGRFAPSADVAGFYRGRAGGSIAVIPRRIGSGGTFEAEPATILLHEYSHHVMMQYGAAAYPAWYREGFAEFNATARFEKDGSIGFGAAANHRAWGLIGRSPLPIELLFDPTRRKLSSAEWEATIYGRGWLLTHYLTFEPTRKGQLKAYLEALNSGKTSLDAAKAAFGDLKALDRELKAYLVKPRIPYLRIAASAVAIEPVGIRTLRPGEAAIMDLRMRSNVGVTQEDAARVARDMRAAAAPYPDDPAVQSALAEAEYDADHYDEADAAADRAIAADSKNVDAWLYKARLRMARAKAGGSTDAAAWKEIRRLILRANQADPNAPEPLILFYQSFAAAGLSPTRNAVEGLLQAFELAPHDVGVRMMAAHQQLVDGKGDAARAALAPIAYDPHGGELAQKVTAILARLDQGGTRAALEAWDSASTEAEKKAG